MLIEDIQMYQLKPWTHMTVPSSKIDRQLFLTTTHITIYIRNSDMAIFWTYRWIFTQSPEIVPDLFKISMTKNKTVRDALHNEKWQQDLAKGLNFEHLAQLTKSTELLDNV
jgi:hypothetical protein